jgi:hypothetical protein
MIAVHPPRFEPRRSLSRPENVGSQYLSLLQSFTSQTFSVEFRAVKKARFRAVLNVGLGVRRPERYGKSLSERPSLSEAWGLADLLYKLFSQQFQCKSIYRSPRSWCSVRSSKPELEPSHRPQAGDEQWPSVTEALRRAFEYSGVGAGCGVRIIGTDGPAPSARRRRVSGDISSARAGSLSAGTVRLSSHSPAAV